MKGCCFSAAGEGGKQVMFHVDMMTCILKPRMQNLTLDSKTNHYIYVSLFIYMYNLTLNSKINHYISSSTAQGNGGSFKHRKPIGEAGEVGCCESRIAGRSN